LQKARAAAFADPKTDVKSKVNIDSQLLQAYLKANDSASASRIQAEISQIDPGNTTTKRLIGNQDLAAGNAASRAGNHQEALNDFLKAVQDGDTGVQVTGYASAALEENDLLNKIQSTTANDYITKMKPYADKALALNPNDPLANFALGVAMTGAWIVGGKTRADYKTQAVAALNKAKAAAQAQGNIALSLNIDNFLKQNIK
ncbi:MAG TPA: hypothetical protein VGR69_07635, partial [Candidatus Rubrimentiphilum sp.]|nr:hypothetical protein [Candidatus Rubrimentiphilum sp.]